MAQVEAVGIAWYRREDYQRLKEMFTDGSKLPDTFDEWFRLARRTYRTLTASGLRVERAYIDPEVFPAWCKANGLKMNAKARTYYGNAVARRASSQ